jgi:hypothetical protein
MIKRLKSFGIVAGSIILTAFISIIPTVEFANFVGWLKGVVVGLGIPVVVWSLGAAFIAQLWFAWRNKVIIAKSVELGETASSSTFRDVKNELY